MSNTFGLDGVSDKDDVEIALELIEEIEQLAKELSEHAEDFGISVDFGMSILETMSVIDSYIKKNNHVTKKQISALENMLDGLRRWFYD